MPHGGEADPFKSHRGSYKIVQKMPSEESLDNQRKQNFIGCESINCQRKKLKNKLKQKPTTKVNWL